MRRVISWASISMIASTAISQAAPLADLKEGQTGRIEFMASNPAHRWALIRGKLGPEQVLTGDLLMPLKKVEGRVPVVVMSHGSDGITSGMFDVWVKALNEAGYAAFVVDSFTPRNSAKISGTDGQLTWNTTVNISDAIYALKLLSTHPKLDSKRIYHMGWSRGANAVTAAMWPNYRLPINQDESIKWAASVAVYPGCNLRYKNPTVKITAPVLYLLGEKDDMTPATPCEEEATLLAKEGQPISYKVYPGAYHVFDRISQPFRKYKEGTFANCSLDVNMPAHSKDFSWGPGLNRETKKVLENPIDFENAINECQAKIWVSVESNKNARESAVRDTIDFFEKNK
jgi:dienelactone hydrolase